VKVDRRAPRPGRNQQHEPARGFTPGTKVTFDTVQRAVACLEGIAIGDAIGKQTEMLSRDEILHWYPDGVRGFEGEPGAIIPRYVGNSKREWRIGETTDDTERTMAVARAIVADGLVSHVSIGREMLSCTKCVHPGLRSLWEFHQAGDPARIADRHDGCGAAVRVAPVGILYRSSSLDALVNGARQASISTHGGPLAIAAAAATAAAVSAAIDAASPEHVLELSINAATLAETQCPGRSTSMFASAIEAVHKRLSHLGVLDAAAVAAICFPNQPLTIVPLALGLATVTRSAAEAILLATNIGGDSDSVASIAGGILAAMYPDSVNEQWCDVVESVNHHDLEGMGERLARLRRGKPDRPDPAA
jgi:ADP-ribosylglycohydrolase